MPQVPTLLALASPHFLWCSMLALSTPPSWHAPSTTRPSTQAIPWDQLCPPSSSLIFTHFNLISWMSSLEKLLQTPSQVHLPICALSRHSIRVIITTRILYLLVLNSIYCPLECKRLERRQYTSFIDPFVSCPCHSFSISHYSIHRINEWSN